MSLERERRGIFRIVARERGDVETELRGLRLREVDVFLRDDVEDVGRLGVRGMGWGLVSGISCGGNGL